MSDATKDTIYIDVDDEITAIIDKVRSSEHKIIALVLPKRAAVLQSIVNMKLLKKAADQEQKKVVLITSEAGLMPIAGIAGLYVASTLQSKPAIPSMPDMSTSADTMEDDELVSETSPEPAAAPPAQEAEETIDVDDPVEPVVASSVVDTKLDKKPKGAKIRIPNFEKFRLKLILGTVLLALLSGGIFAAMTILPKATVVVRTDISTVASSFNFTANVDAKTVDVEKSVIPAGIREVKKTDTNKVKATGQKNIGEKAKGTLAIYNCTDTKVVLPAGTAFSNSGISFGLDIATEVPASDFFSNGNCKKNTSMNAVVTAITSGGSSNLSAGRTYTSGFANTLSATGSAMTGGTDKTIITIAAADIETAKSELTDKSKEAASAELIKTITDAKLVALNESITSNTPTVTSTPNVGDEAAEVSVTMVTTYQMQGIASDNLKKLVDNDIKKKIDQTKQPITDYGFAKAIYHVTDKRSPTDQTIQLKTSATAGTKIDPEALKRELVGKKRSEVQQAVLAHPGVKEVNTSFSPFWVSKIPSKLSRTTVIFEQVTSSATPRQ